MAINNFKPFALDPNANVTSQADWEALPALLSGFTAGKASSAQVNKAIRQASFIAAALAQYTANKSGLDVLDDGDLNGFISKMGTAFGKDFQALDATLSALAGLATGANKLPYFTGNDTAAQTDLTSVGRDIIGKNTIADILTYLGFGKRLLEADGYFELPGGLLLQWGHGSVQAYNTTVRFKKPFNVTPFIVLPHKITADNRYVTSVNYTLTGFSLYGWGGSGTASNIDSYTYFALGI
ncbi:gp53-like domain-containing protein [Escherichia coli]